MQQAALITFGVDDSAVERLQALVRDRGVTVRITRDPKACLNLLRQGVVGVLLFRVGANLETEFTLLSQVAQQFPQVAPIVWGRSDHPRLGGLAWDLGARCVLLGPTDQNRLDDAILHLLPG
jgi:DNA-binding NarL/FixJ family response regulator